MKHKSPKYANRFFVLKGGNTEYTEVIITFGQDFLVNNQDNNTIEIHHTPKCKVVLPKQVAEDLYYVLGKSLFENEENSENNEENIQVLNEDVENV